MATDVNLPNIYFVVWINGLDFISSNDSVDCQPWKSKFACEQSLYIKKKQQWEPNDQMYRKCKETIESGRKENSGLNSLVELFLAAQPSGMLWFTEIILINSWSGHNRRVWQETLQNLSKVHYF